MNFQELHESLRAELVRRIDSGLLTGTLLARQTGYRQAHMSNFLNRKRSLSLEGLDRVLAAQSLTIEQILPLDLNASAHPHALAHDRVETIPVVDPSTAANDVRVSDSAILETIQVPASRLYSNRSRPLPSRAQWQRFLAFQLDAGLSAPMEPILSSGSIVVIDRHYNSLAPHSARQPTIYAVREGRSLELRYAALEKNCLVLRPNSLDYPVQIVPISTNDSSADHIVGRICMLLSDL